MPTKKTENIREVEAVFHNRFNGQTDRKKIRYIVKADPPKGAMKKVYFSTDGKWALQFFHDPEQAVRKGIRGRIEAILGPYNPTLSTQEGGAAMNPPQAAEYFRKQYCWPVATVEDAQFGFGIVCPKYPRKFSFGDSVSLNPAISRSRKGKDKKSTWFVREQNRASFKKTELGDFRKTFQICVNLARSIRRLHAAGLAHSDLSGNNVLIDPVTGSCIIIDIDSLVVPHIYPPEVMGTPWYIAPEVLETKDLPFDSEKKHLPCIFTDLHAMAVLIYELLLLRHPLDGPKQYNVDDPNEEDLLIYGSRACFIEDPKDNRNRPPDLKVTIADMGPKLADLFVKALSDGLHDPYSRPPALMWENVLSTTMDLLHPCENPDCPMHWFVLHNPQKPECPFCHSVVKARNVARMIQKRAVPGQHGQWIPCGEVDLYDGKELFRYHFFPNSPRGESASPDELACVKRERNRFVLYNRNLPELSADNGDPIPPGQKVELREGTRLCTSRKEDGLLLEIFTGGGKAGRA